MSIIQSGSKVTQSGIDIDIQVRMKNGNKLTLRLGADVPKELKKQAVKLAFEAIKNILPASKSDYKGVFNIQENAWSIFTMQEYNRKLLAKGK